MHKSILLPRTPQYPLYISIHIHSDTYTHTFVHTFPYSTSAHWHASDALCCLYSILSAKLLFVFIYPPHTHTQLHIWYCERVSRLHILYTHSHTDAFRILWVEYNCVCLWLLSVCVCVCATSVLHIYNLCFVIQLTFSADKHFCHMALCCIANNLKSHFIQFQSYLRALTKTVSRGGIGREQGRGR